MTSPEAVHVLVALQAEDRGYAAPELARITGRSVRSVTALASALAKQGRVDRFVSTLGGRRVTYYQHLDMVRGALLSIGEIARFSQESTAYFGARLTEKQVEGWARTRVPGRSPRLLKAGSKADGTALYRAGDVLALVEERKAS